ncbi:GAF domain-containing protein [Rhodobacteraceae bacterium NNCM2]|nr:GAF domain-containing protein [Coraliihabitans acroporae]
MPDDAPMGETGQDMRHLQMLLDVSRQVAAMDTLDAVLDKLVSVAVSETGAERGSLFLRDEQTGELYSRVAQGVRTREIRILQNEGIAGAVYRSGQGEIIEDAYDDPRFNPKVDEETGFRTRSMLCMPLRNAKGRIIGVTQILNKRDGLFTEHDMAVVDGVTTQCAITLESIQMVEHIETVQTREREFLNVVTDMTSDLDLTRLLQKVMSEASRMLDAERSTLFLNDEANNELFSHVGEGLSSTEIRLPNHVGIAGTVFTSGKSVNIPHAYADLRFNPSFDRQTGFFTRSILCVPVINKQGKVIGVTQVLNKRGGPFTDEDENRLRAFTAQISIGLENAKLFDDVQSMKNYNESMLQSMSNGVITFDDNCVVKTCNGAGIRILRAREDDLIGQGVDDVFGETAPWLAERVKRVEETRTNETAVDLELLIQGKTVSANITVLPLTSGEGTSLGTLVIIEDISSEKRVKSTMARYMDPDLADRLLSEGGQEELLGGQDTTATVLFSDIRGFTSITEKLGAQGTVALLNDYFERMVDCISDEGGILDKFIGDAIMAAFGVPVTRGEDEDRAMRAGIKMVRRLWEWNEERREKGLITLDMGIGLNTDRIVAGNIGSPKRMDYTMIGDGVNLAARLEGACKQYKARILVSEMTAKRLRGIYRLREIDKVIVKGKTEPVAVFEALDYHTDQSFPNMSDVLGHFGEGVKSYRAQDWGRAIHCFEMALSGNAQDQLSQIYIDRCKVMQANPPGKAWNGVWVLNEK